MNSKTIKHVLLGFLLALCTISLHLVLNKNQGLELTSLLLVIIGSVYYGFALLSHHKKAIIIEIIVASFFISMAAAGLWISPWILIVGLFLHGFWDIAHHNQTFKLVKIPKWYIPFCATYDWTIAAYLIYLLI